MKSAILVAVCLFAISTVNAQTSDAEAEAIINLIGVIAKMTEDEKNEARKAHGFEHVGPPLTFLKKS